MLQLNTIITGTGSYIPTEVITNQQFSAHKFYDTTGVPFNNSHEDIAEKFIAITGIHERRYVSEDLHASDIGTIAAERAIQDAGINKEEIDQIIVAQNFGDVSKGTIQTDSVPSIAARIKHGLNIENPGCVAYDLVFGCPGWIQGLIHAKSFIQSGLAKKCLVIGTETLSRVIDQHDRDSMLYSDGAGACIVEGIESDQPLGILTSSTASFANEEAYFLYFGKSNIDDSNPNVKYIKMYGRKVYEFALKHVPHAMKDSLDRAGVDIHDLKKVLIHQANEKLDAEVIKRFYRLYGIRQVPEFIMPMSIHKLGNSSVATVPTLLDLIRKKQIEGHELNKGDVIMFSSVGAGMNLNAITYRY
ncbi:MAG TPA: ketoacyl-ACP synthase III [Bacteroidales bacterium]|nr:ketoacyl-ACP synthase III [Bacteroidales bacterium]